MTPQEGERLVDDGLVMASIDRGPDGDHLVIADITVDGRWLSVPLPHAVALSEHR